MQYVRPAINAIGLARSAYNAYRRYGSKGGRKFRKVMRRPYSKVANKMLRAPKLEVKYLDYGDAVNFYTANGFATYTLCGITEGTDYNNRIGRVVTARYVQLDITIIPPVTVGAYDYVRWALVYDAQPNAATASFSDIFDCTTITNKFQTFKDIAKNGNRFIILRQGVMGPLLTGTNVDNAHTRVFVKVPTKLACVRYPQSSASIPQSGNFLLTMANYFHAYLDTDHNCGYNFSSRFAFTDA